MAEILNSDIDNQNQNNGGLGKFKSWKQKEALEKLGRSGNAKRAAGLLKVGNPKKLTEKRLASLKKGNKKAVKKTRILGDITKKKILKEFVKSNDLTRTAKNAGVSYNHASNTLKALEKSGTLQLAFKKMGLDYDCIANDLKDLIDYNKQKIEKPVGLDRSIEEMRDARVALDSIKTVAKFTAISADTLHQSPSEFSSSQILLAIKSLVQKLNADELKIVVESCECMLAEMAKGVNVDDR
tara:strand:+ start:51 stop:770 length:720 start_codon:yes stop_codon:yes gene_type:complete